MKNKLFLAITICGLMLSACKKEEKKEEEETNNNNGSSQSSTPMPKISDADAVLVALNTVNKITTPLGEQTITIGTAVANFYDASTKSTLVEAGTVKINNKALTKGATNSYSYTPSQTEPTGLDLSGDITWEATGSSAFTAIAQRITVNTMPTTPAISCDAEVSGTDYTITNTASVSNADSLIYVLIGPSGSVTITKHKSVNSATFTADQVKSVGTGAGYAEIAAYNAEMHQEGAELRKAYYINEAVATKAITLK